MSGTSLKVADFACDVSDALAFLVKQACDLFKGRAVGGGDPGIAVNCDWHLFLFRY